MTHGEKERTSARWAHLRFSVVGRLLCDPPKKGQLEARLRELSETTWRHPTTGEDIRFGFSTIQRWYYLAKNASNDPIGALERQTRKDAGRSQALSKELAAELRGLYAKHSNWTYLLHFENLEVLQKEDPDRLGPMPSYSSVRRHMISKGMRRKKKARNEGQRRARARIEALEVRSYESEYVSGLWHLDFHEGSRSVLTSQGQWVRPLLLGILDDHSRLACHVQWYLHETAETLVHGLSQAIQKHGVPRSLMTDNGSAMKAEETVAGLRALSIVHDRTLEYSPYAERRVMRSHAATLARSPVPWPTRTGESLCIITDRSEKQ